MRYARNRHSHRRPSAAPETTVVASTEPDHVELDPYVITASGGRICVDLDELRARLAAQPVTPLHASGVLQQLDQPDRRGGVRWNADGPERIPDDAHPLELALRTQQRRDAARRGTPTT